MKWIDRYNHIFKSGKYDWDEALDTDEIFKIASRILKKNTKMLLFSQQPFTTKLLQKQHDGIKHHSTTTPNTIETSVLIRILGYPLYYGAVSFSFDSNSYINGGGQNDPNFFIGNYLISLQFTTKKIYFLILIIFF